MTYREKLVQACTAKALELNRKLVSIEIVNLACELHDESAKKPKGKVQLADEEWICTLEADPTFSGIDVRREIGKCQAWANLRPGIQVTRRRVIAWLSKAERPIGYNGAGQSSNGPRIKANGIQEPTGWLMWLSVNRPECIYNDGRSWATIDPVGQQYIIDQMKPEVKPARPFSEPTNEEL